MPTLPTPPTPGDSPRSWAVVIPVKELSKAKSRLQPPTGVSRARLALAMASDVIVAAMACSVVGRVVVVTNDAVAADAARSLGAEVIADGPDAGLNPALEHAAAILRSERWDSVAAISSDLPALRADELATALAAVASDSRAVVADADGRGTVLLAARGVALAARFGPSSLELHLQHGAHDLGSVLAEPSGLRHDVDTAHDLERAGRIGLGMHTSAVLSDNQAATALGR